ncbi:YqcI/YcgG family protein [Cytobacillus solani]|uniref:YqcI/YcgG family protein n=1 Tax=Cytobacillus solani TaxID=1637975 RepID=A0A0Q3VHT7_9BACI|nr:YqcI/YcgG family protein [Cytobacillus solani]KOP82983.1 hypothetical protein AMS60_11185 [Bacillus sp. FJAT-21945]KQL20007.1 hypothetical protein AN957_16490 [Cytobacillus solani]USK53253.1 YqcI/YcgG family protein [Cytobacillus solani]
MQLLEGKQIESVPYLLDQQWQYEAFKHFKEKMSDTNGPFPCIPATIGFKLNHFRYGFLGDPRLKETSAELAELLKTFGQNSKSFGHYTSLIAIFHTPEDLIRKYSLADYRLLFWSLLSEISKLDEREWPPHIPRDPEHHVWEYCFGGEQYFMYCATPSHKKRKTRHFPYFIFAITPRWVLVEFNSAIESAKKMREKIRERIVNYDTIEIHPDLNLYGSKGNFEWKQYFLSDDLSTPSRCPFTSFHADKFE